MFKVIKQKDIKYYTVNSDGKYLGSLITLCRQFRLIVIVYLFSVFNGKHDYAFCTAINISILIKKHFTPKNIH